MRLVAYTRRSTERQVASPETQLREIEEYCARHGHVLVRTYHEIAITGATEIERRTALPQLIADIRAPGRDFDAVIVWKLDRLMRNVAEYHRTMQILDKHKCAILSLKDPVTDRKTASDRLVSGILADMAAYEREVTGERIYAHHRTAFLNGKWPGGPQSMGLKWDKSVGKFHVNGRAADVIRIFETYIATNGNGLETARRLNAAGIRTQKGNVWSATTVYHAIRNPIYRQRLTYDELAIDAREIVPEVVPPPILHQADLLLERVRTWSLGPRRIGSKHAYSGIIHCSQCGRPMIGSFCYTRGIQYMRWVCGNAKFKGICKGKQVSGRRVEILVAQAVQDLFRRYEDILAHQPSAISHQPSGEIAGLKEKRRRLQDAYLDGLFTRSEFQSRMMDIEKQLAADRPAPAKTLPVAEISALIEQLGDEWKDLPTEDKRGLLMKLGVEMRVNTTGSQPLWLELTADYLADPIRVNLTYNWAHDAGHCD